MGMLLDYLHAYPNAKLRFDAGNMQLNADSGAAYLVFPGAKSCFAGHFYLQSLPNALNNNGVPNNAPIHTKCRTIKSVVCLAAEAECGSIFYNSQTAIVIHRILEEIGHPQQPMKVKTDNATANSVVHASMRVKQSKSWDIEYHWPWEATIQEALWIFWDKGANNDVDCFTRHHPPSHHKVQRPRYILKGFNATILCHTLNQRSFWMRVCLTTT
eukprot:12167824-Ditylum_brightwellii.AAC.1